MLLSQIERFKNALSRCKTNPPELADAVARIALIESAMDEYRAALRLTEARRTSDASRMRGAVLRATAAHVESENRANMAEARCEAILKWHAEEMARIKEWHKTALDWHDKQAAKAFRGKPWKHTGRGFGKVKPPWWYHAPLLVRPA